MLLKRGETVFEDTQVGVGPLLPSGLKHHNSINPSNCSNLQVPAWTGLTLSPWQPPMIRQRNSRLHHCCYCCFLREEEASRSLLCFAAGGVFLYGVVV